MITLIIISCDNGAQSYHLVFSRVFHWPSKLSHESGLASSRLWRDLLLSPCCTQNSIPSKALNKLVDIVVQNEGAAFKMPLKTSLKDLFGTTNLGPCWGRLPTCPSSHDSPSFDWSRHPLRMHGRHLLGENCGGNQIQGNPHMGGLLWYQDIQSSLNFEIKCWLQETILPSLSKNVHPNMNHQTWPWRWAPTRYEWAYNPYKPGVK